MAFTRSRYGIEHNDTARTDEGHPLRFLFVVLILLASICFACARGCARAPVAPLDAARPIALPPPAPPEPEAPPVPATAAATNATAAPVPPRVPETTAPAAPSTAPSDALKLRRVARWREAALTRPAAEATLLARLADAEQRNNIQVARDSLEKLRSSPAMADLEDPLDRRLGELNAALLFTPPPGTRDGWTTYITIRKGDSIQRLAREHGTTPGAILRLNGLADGNRIRAGTRLRTLEFPRAALVIHANARTADLSLNRRFFKRYYISLPPQPRVGHYPITREEGPLERFTALGLRLTPADRSELALLLAPGSYITLAL